MRSDTLSDAVKRANENLAERDLPPLSAKITTHSLRRTSATLLYALGGGPPAKADVVPIERAKSAAV